MKLQNTIVALLSTICIANAEANGWYLGVSTGVVDSDFNDFDTAFNAGFLAGYDVFTKDVFTASIETEFTTTLASGDVDFSGTDGNWEIDTQAAYVAFRGGQKFYIKTRFGILRSDISFHLSGDSQSDKDTGISWSGALGWKYNERLGIQLDGTLVDTDTTYWNLGLVYLY